MRVTKLLPMIPLVIVMVIGDTKHDISDEEKTKEENNISESVGTARIFPLLPPYQGVDFAANFNKLKSAGDAAYFVVRDGITVSKARGVTNLCINNNDILAKKLLV